MPWKNQNGKKDQGSSGPWTQRPSGGDGLPPDFEDFLRKSRDQFRHMFSRGRNASPNGVSFIFTATAIVVCALFLWAAKSIYTVQPDELAVELFLGKAKEEISDPGLHFYFWPIEAIYKVNTAEKLVSIGFGSRESLDSGLMLSGDQNIVDVRFSIAYQVKDPNLYLFKVFDADSLVRQLGESAMREVVGRRPAQDIFRDNRQKIADQVRTIIQSSLDEYQAGLMINAISIEDASPPSQVSDAFNEVQRAEQDEDRFIEEANQYANQKLGQARGRAAQITEEAAAYKTRIVQESQGEARRFLSVHEQYVKAPDVTRKRLFLETMEKVLKDSNKIIVDSRTTQGVLPYLPLPALKPAPSSVQGEQ